MDSQDVLIVHLGGLGDVCLSESVFHSLRVYFSDHLTALGNKRFLDLFGEHFHRVEGIESRKWLYLFSQKLCGPVWKQIIFIGKDKDGILRQRWQQFSREKLIFVDMYPEGAFGEITPESNLQEQSCKGLHIEDYQLLQLEENGIKSLKKVIKQNGSARVVLYPERGFTKEKWPADDFLRLYRSLEKKGIDVTIQEPLGLTLDVERKLSCEDLSEVKRFYSEGGIFVSNDSGMAHLAGACGLSTVTIFTDFDPHIWHPRGEYYPITAGHNPVTVEAVEQTVLNVITADKHLSG